MESNFKKCTHPMMLHIFIPLVSRDVSVLVYMHLGGSSSGIWTGSGRTHLGVGAVPLLGVRVTAVGQRRTRRRTAGRSWRRFLQGPNN